MFVKRLPFKLAEYNPRTTWVSVRAREVWQPRISRISQAWQAVERLLVRDKARPSALQNVAPEALPALLSDLSKDGLVVLPLGRVAKPAAYQSASVQLAPNEPWDYRCAITTPDKAAEWAAAWAKSDNDQIGKLLGYPDCCRAFFQQIWVKERWFDTTWPMTQSEGDVKDIAVGINLLWRWHGVRSVSHLPCSFGCEKSIEQGEVALQIMERYYPEEAVWMREILNWPVEWSALHGIGELRTPITRTSFATDATAGKLVVRYHGPRYPEEGAIGLTFPHRKAAAKPLTLLRLSNSKDNGFATHAAMQEAHNQLLAKLSPPYGTVLDLGCGDGVLLSKIACNRRIGVEIDARVAKLAENRLNRVVVGDVIDRNLVNRLIEEEKPDLVLAQQDRNPIETLHCNNILSYSYENGVTATLFVK